MRKFITYGPAIVVLLATGVVLFAAPGAIKQAQLARLTASVELAQLRLDRSDLLEQLNRERQLLAEAVLPSVVHLQVETDDGGSSGSGWVYDNRGYLVSNAHVVEGAEAVRVELFDGRVRDARVVGVDRKTDIAVLEIDPGPEVVPMRRASGAPLRVGDQVFAFGSPFGIKFSMSRGIVSGLGRSDGASFINLREGYTNFIQTDAAINPGNSGGPLVDVNGRLVGMNAAIANNQRGRGGEEPLQGQSAGIGFAIPVETLESIVGQLVDDEIVLRGYLGILLEPFAINRSDAERRGLVGTGVYVRNTPEGQPAARAGLEAGDIIVEIAGQPTPNPAVLRAIVSVQRPGTTVPVRVFRQNDRFETIDVTLGAAIDGPRGRGLRYIPGSELRTVEELRREIAER